MTQFEKLKAKLSELFQLDQADLDFGIYRIMNARRDEITQFLERDLLPQVTEAFSQYAPSDKAEIQKQLDEVIAGVKAAGMDPEDAPKVKELRARLADDAVDLTALENEVYSRLYDFFNRYYDEGDFISLRRYKEGVYAIPYEGEEVKLHWANSDQYYVKTTENFRDYAFKTADGHRVHFKIIEADTEKDNVKAANGNDRRFLLCGENPLTEEDGELVIRFEYRPDGEKRKQDAINAETAQQVIESLNGEELAAWQHRLGVNWARADGTASERTILEKHLSDYTKRNTFDYFIHKDLDGFLRRELDFYIKNEVMHLDDVENESVPRVEQYLSKIKVIRQIAHKIIDFLAQIEDFQKTLWLKKKFVTETNYCITLDRVPEELYPEIAANDAQREEWAKLFAIDEIKAGGIQQDRTKLFSNNIVGYSEPLTVEFLKANPFLLLDTQFFSREFRDRLLSSIEDIESGCDGLLVKSENFQSLHLLQDRYREQVSCIYIDPPYNTNATPILYKNEYMSSSWLSLMADRLRLGFGLLAREKGYGTIAIDDHELGHLSQLLECQFPSWELHRVIVNHYPGSGTGRSNVTRTHEYALFLTPGGQDLLRGEARNSGWRERGFCRSGTGENNYRSGRPNSFYAVLVEKDTCEIHGFEPPPAKGSSDYPKEATKEGYQRIYPIGGDGSERCWTLSYESAKAALQDGLLKCTANLVIKRRYFDEEARNLLPSVWVDTQYSAVTHGTNLLTDMFGDSGLFSYPKSVFTVMTAIEAGTFSSDDCTVFDYFAGSGTTGHAVIRLNRRDEGKRQYILVEMGDYFDTVTKPRIQKAIYSKNWKDGKPVLVPSVNVKQESPKLTGGEGMFKIEGQPPEVSENPECDPGNPFGGISHMFKYIRLESYEDALANIRLKRTDTQQSLLDGSDSFRESYMLGYMLDTEAAGSPSLLNIDAFEDPFNYKLLVGTGSVGETRPVNVDLVETFNWLLGLRVKHVSHIRGIRVVEGENPKGEKVLVIWRNVKETSNEDLEEFFRKQQYNTLDMEFDLVYVNGDNNLMNIPVVPEEEGVEPGYKVRLIEEEFKRLMFDVKDV